MTITRHAYAIAGLITILTAISMSSTAFKAAPPSASTVTVGNTAANPVPVALAAGTNVGINGTPTVMIAGTPNVQVTGTPNVNIANTPDVNISTSTASPVHSHNIAEADSNHVAGTISVTIPNGSGVGTDTVYTVPAGKVLVVKDISFRAVLANSAVLEIAMIKGTSSGNLTEAFVPMQQVTIDAGPSVATSIGQAIGCSYVFEAGPVQAQVTRNTTANIGTVFVTINGYLEDAD